MKKTSSAPSPKRGECLIASSDARIVRLPSLTSTSAHRPSRRLVITTRAAPGGKTADALAWRGAVERAHDSALLENHDLRRAGDDAQRRDATVLQRRSEPLPGAFADRAAHAVRV